MSVGFNNSYRSYSAPTITFGHNKGVLNAVKALREDKSHADIEELQAQLQDIKFTPDFVETIKGYPDYWKQVLVKYASPKEIQDGLKRIFGME